MIEFGSSIKPSIAFASSVSVQKGKPHLNESPENYIEPSHDIKPVMGIWEMYTNH